MHIHVYFFLFYLMREVWRENTTSQAPGILSLIFGTGAGLLCAVVRCENHNS